MASSLPPPPYGQAVTNNPSAPAQQQYPPSPAYGQPVPQPSPQQQYGQPVPSPSYGQPTPSQASVPLMAPNTQQSAVQGPPPAAAPMSAWDQYCIASEVKAEIKADLFRALAENTTVVLLLDDSGSMQTSVRPPGASAFSAPTTTRWTELQNDTQNIVNLVTAVNPRGCDIFFMNRPGAKGVMSVQQIAPMFINPPTGGTPMISSIRKIVSEYRNTPGRVLFILITDGEPSDGEYSDLKSVFLSMPQNFFTSMVECNDNEEEMDYLTGWDMQIPRWHNQEDYGEELKLVQMVQGPNAKFTRANYVQMIILSPIFPQYAIDMRVAGGKRNPFGGGGGGYAQPAGGFGAPAYGYPQQGYPPQQGYGGYPQQGYQPAYGVANNNSGACCIIL